jgi:hypothetical protein
MFLTFGQRQDLCPMLFDQFGRLPSQDHQLPKHRGSETPKRGRNYLQVAAFVVSFLLLVANIFQACSAKNSADAARDAARIAGEQVHIGQRAYLIFHHAVLEHSPRPNEDLKAIIDLTNNGQTPAVEVSYFLNLSIYPTIPVIRNTVETPMVPIAASQTIKVSISLLNKLTQQEVADLITKPITLDGNLLTIRNVPHLYFVGIIHYKDVFGRDAETKFCDVWTEDQFIGCTTQNSNTMK